jgi:hypothetical protein
VKHAALQRALVIALHDATFVAAMHDDPDRTLAPLGLGAEEMAQLLAVDRRAFATDPLRSRRVLRVLAEELKVSTTLALWETRSAAFAMGFFGSRFFRTAVADRTALAPAYGEYLAAALLRTPQTGDVIRLETLLARCRRARLGVVTAAVGVGVSVGVGVRVGLASGVASAAFDAGVLETIRVVERFLFELGLMPQLAWCADGPVLPELPPVGGGTMYLLVTPNAGGVELAPIDEDLHRVLSALAQPVAREHVASVLVTAGVPERQAGALVASLVEDGLVVEI